jgi:hypothetical protein
MIRRQADLTDLKQSIPLRRFRRRSTEESGG